jgi:hypothetical protein
MATRIHPKSLDSKEGGEKRKKPLAFYRVGLIETIRKELDHSRDDVGGFL